MARGLVLAPLGFWSFLVIAIVGTLVIARYLERGAKQSNSGVAVLAVCATCATALARFMYRPIVITDMEDDQVNAGRGGPDEGYQGSEKV